MYVSKRSPLSAVSGVYNAILVKGESTGELMFYGKGAGSLPTADAVVGDIIRIIENKAVNDCWERYNDKDPSPVIDSDFLVPIF